MLKVIIISAILLFLGGLGMAIKTLFRTRKTAGEGEGGSCDSNPGFGCGCGNSSGACHRLSHQD